MIEKILSLVNNHEEKYHQDHCYICTNRGISFIGISDNWQAYDFISGRRGQATGICK